MCLFISGVITPEKTYFSIDNDSHIAIREFFHITDDVRALRPINSANVELVPIDKNIFNLDPSNWQLSAEFQQEIPEWFTNSAREFVRQEMLLCLEQRAKRRFHINSKERVTIEEGIHYTLNSVVIAINHAEVHAYGDSKIYAKERSAVHAHDNSNVSGFDSAIIKAKDNSTVSLYDHSCCIEALDRVCIEANSLSSAKVHSPEVTVRVDEYAVVRVCIHPALAINFSNYQIGTYGRPILDFIYQNKLFTKDEQLDKLRNNNE